MVKFLRQKHCFLSVVEPFLVFVCLQCLPHIRTQIRLMREFCNDVIKRYFRAILLFPDKSAIFCHKFWKIISDPPPEPLNGLTFAVATTSSVSGTGSPERCRERKRPKRVFYRCRCWPAQRYRMRLDEMFARRCFFCQQLSESGMRSGAFNPSQMGEQSPRYPRCPFPFFALPAPTPPSLTPIFPSF